MINLSPRLKTIYDIIPSCKTVADIGTDHAYLPVCLCQNNKCDTAIASDIVKGPLERAKATILKYNMKDRVSVRLGSGVSTLKENEADVVVIAGMGGLIIADILNEGREIIKSANKIILQPMTAISDLREFLYKNNWKIHKEYLVKENDKLYNILTVSVTDSKSDYTDADIFIGNYLIKNKPEHFNEYLEKKLKKLKNKLNGLSVSNSDISKEQLSTVKKRLDMTEKIKEEISNGL